MKFKKLISSLIIVLIIVFSFMPLSIVSAKSKDKKNFIKNFKKHYYEKQIKDLNKGKKKTKTTYELKSNNKKSNGGKQSLSTASISSANDLLSIPDNSNETYKLTSNIDMKNVGDFVSIKNFSGKFDGGGYTIKNLTGGALFDDVIGGEITNLKLKGSVPSLKGDGDDYGFIANTLTSGAKMSKCHVKIDFDIKNIDLDSSLGLLVAKGPSTNNFTLNLGMLTGRVDNSVISDCSASVFLLRLGMTSLNYAGAPKGDNILINSNIGGLIGTAENHSKIENCMIKSIKKKITYIDEGEEYSFIEDGVLTTFADYDVGVNKNYEMNTNTGAILGRVDNSEVTNCHADVNYLSSNKLLTNKPTSDVEDVKYFSGGIAGLVANSSNVSQCSNRNELLSFSEGPVNGDTFIITFDHVNSALGGIAGATKDNSLIQECYNASIDNSIFSEGDDVKVGGIVGYNDNGCEVKNCINIGFFNAEVGLIDKIKPYAGGLVGYNKGKIDTSYNTGIGYSTRANDHPSYYGAVAGANEGEIGNVYYMENNKVSVPDTKNKIDNSKKLTIDEMKKAENYVGFDNSRFSINKYRNYSMMNIKNNSIERDFVKSISISPKSKTLYYNAAYEYSEYMFDISISPESNQDDYAYVNTNKTAVRCYDDEFNIKEAYYSSEYIDDEDYYDENHTGLPIGTRKAGTSKIYLVSTDGNYVKSNTVTVQSKKMILTKKIKFKKSKITIQKGKTAKLKLVYSPKNTQVKRVIYTSSNKKIASINQKGVVKAKKKGKVTIKAKTVDGSEKTAKVTILVK